MRRSFRRATRALVALWIAAFVSGCHTAAPPRQASHSGASAQGYASAETTSGSFGIAIFASAPRPPIDDGSIWYYGGHPHPANYAPRSFCDLRGSHRHDYAPYRNHRYVFHDGHYFWIGDAKPYALQSPSYAYYGHHPLPHYFGGTCRIRGLHRHAYAPTSGDYYRMTSGAYFYTGVFDTNYYAERDRYDARGWDFDHRTFGYHDHESDWQGESVTDAADENRPVRSRAASQFSLEDSAAFDSVDRGARARARSQQGVDRPAQTSPYGAVDSAERFEIHQVTPRELLERMRARTRDASGGTPANAAAD